LSSGFGYDRYRGRSGAKRILSILIAALFLVLVLLVVAFFWLQKHIVYTDDGHVRVELPPWPWQQQQEEEPPPVSAAAATPTPQPPLPSGALVVVTVPPEDVPTPTPTPTPVQEQSLSAAMLEESLLNGSPLPEEAVQGLNAVIFDMKGDDGRLRYVSDLEEAGRWGTSAAGAGRNEAIRAVTQGEIYTIARVSCFRDNLAPKMQNRLAIRSPIGNWRDGSGVRWMSPAVPEARAYVAGVCRELAALGFDEILLDNAGFPLEGNLGYIVTGERYDPEDLTGPVETFYQEVQAALADYPDVKLSFSLPPDAAAREGSASGQNAALAAGYAWRAYVATEDAAALGGAQSALEAAGMPAGRVVSWHALNPDAGTLAAEGGEAVYLP